MPALASRPWAALRRHPRLRFAKAALGRCVAALEKQPGPKPPTGELSIAFLTDEELARIHGDFLADPSCTDVITFPGDSGSGLAGEICVSVDQAAAQAAKRKITLARELTLYLVHGWLHLCGYDDRTSAQRRVMRRMERRMLGALQRERAFPDFRLASKRAHR